jgi:hypothetical protein
MGAESDTAAVHMDSSGRVDESAVDSARGAVIEGYASELIGQLDDPGLDPSMLPEIEQLAHAAAQLGVVWRRPVIAARLWLALGSRIVRTQRQAGLADAVNYLSASTELLQERRDEESDYIYARSSVLLAVVYTRLPVSNPVAVVSEVVKALNNATERLPASADDFRARYISVWGDLIAHSQLRDGLGKDDIVRARKEALDYLATPERGQPIRYLVSFTAGVSALQLGAISDSEVSLRECYEGAVAAGDSRTAAEVLKLQANAVRSRGRRHGLEAADLQNQGGTAYAELDEPTEAADAYRAAGMLYLENSEWAKAANAFRLSLELADRSLVRAGSDPDVRMRTWRRSGALQALTFALARHGDSAGAAEAADRSRAWRLRSMPRIGNAAFLHIREHDPELAKSYLDLHMRIRAAEIIEGEVRDAPGESAIAQLGGTADDLARLRMGLEALRGRMAGVPGGDALMGPSTLDRIRAALPENAIGAYIIATPYGGLGILVGRESVATVDLAALTLKSVSAHLGAVSEAYDAVRKAGEDPQPTIVWDRLIDATCKWLWIACMGPIVEAAGKTERLVLFAGGGLDFLPLHAAWHETSAGREYVIDRVAVSYAPCADLQPQVPVASEYASRPALLIGNPEPTSASPLWGAKVEADALGSGFSNKAILSGHDATVENVTKLMPECGILHFACHGYTHFGRPYASFLLLSCDRRLTMSEIVDLPLTERPSVFLSACETGLHDFELADEVQSLSSAFLAAGARDVISTLWSVDDASALAVSARIYDARFRGLPGPEAVRDAQRWMRDTAKQQKATDVEGFIWMEPGARTMIATLLRESAADHSRPQHWAAHVYSGAP